MFGSLFKPKENTASTFQELQDKLTTDGIMKAAGVAGGGAEIKQAQLKLADATILEVEKMVRTGKSEPYEQQRFKAAGAALQQGYQESGLSAEEAATKAMEDAANLIKVTAGYYSALIGNGNNKSGQKRLR